MAIVSAHLKHVAEYHS